MPRKQKGVNPLIATILLLLVCMAIGGIIWSWVQGFAQTQRSATEEQSKKQAGCAGAAFTIDLSDVKPTYSAGLDQVKLVIINKGDRDLNQFWVNGSYPDGTSDQNLHNNVDLEEGGTAVLWSKGGKSLKPLRIVVESVDCEGMTADLADSQIEGGA